MAASADLRVVIRAIDEASRPISGIARALGTLQGAATAPVKAIGGLVEGLGKLGLAALGVDALASSARGLGDALGLGVLNQLEQASASINAFTKDAGQTEQILQMVKKRAAETPFGLTEMNRAVVSLLPAAKSSGVALEGLIETAEILAASNPSEGLEGASFALREALSGDWVSLQERFNIPRTAINQLKAQGLPALEIVRRAMQGMGLDAELVAAQSQTLQGRWSTFLDTLDQIKATVAQPIFDALKEGLTSLQGVLDGNMPTIQAFAQELAGNIKNGIEAAKNAFVTFGPVVLSTLGSLRDQVAPIVQIVADAFRTVVQVFQQDWSPDESINPIVNAIGNFAVIIRDQVLPAIQEFAAAAGPAIAAAFAWLVENGPSLLPIVAGIAAGFAAFSVISTVVGWITGLIAAFAAVGATITASGGVIAGIVAILGGPVTLAIAAVAAAIGLLVVAWSNNWFDIQGKVQAAWAVIQPILFAVGAELLRFGAEMLPLVQSAWAGIQNAIQVAWTFIQGLITVGVALVSTAWSQNWLGIRDIAQTIWDAIKLNIDTTWTLIQGVIKTGLQLLSGDWSGAWSTIQTTVTTILDAVLKFVNEKTEGIRSAFATAMEKIGNAISPVGNAIDGLKKSAEGLWKWLQDHVFNFKINLPSLPDWAIPGSPTPFEIGLRGIADALQEVNRIAAPSLGGVAPAAASNLVQPAGVGVGSINSGPSISVGQIVIEGAADPAATARAVRDELVKLARRNGQSAFAGVA